MDCQGIIFDIDSFAVHDGPGIRTVIYLKGCPLRCVWCHSPESQSLEPQLLYIAERCQHCTKCLDAACPHQAKVVSGRRVSSEQLVRDIVQDKVFFDASGGGVTLSGGEVLFQPVFSASLLAQFQSYGIHTLVETSGMGKWEYLRNISHYTDEFYYDIKSLDDDKHVLYTGAGNGAVLDNLRKLTAYRMGKGITLRVPLIPGYNDASCEVKGVYHLAGELGLSQVHLLRYNNTAPAKYQWLDQPYQPGCLASQHNAYVEALASAPEGLQVTVY